MEEEKEKKVAPFIASEVLHDGTIIEMLYDPVRRETKLACYRNGKCDIRSSYELDDVILKPHPADRDLLRSRVVLFPSAPKEYGTQRELIDRIQTFIHKYLSVSEFFERIASYYILFSWVHDDFNELPYLRGLGDFGTGKSRLLQVVGSVCYRPIFATGATTISPIFRILNDFKGTLILDEADFDYSDTTVEIIKILNSGFMKGMSVLRSESNSKKNFDVKAYSVFGPKLIATRFLYKDAALESRMITEDMNMNVPRKDIPYNIPDSFWDEALDLRNQLLMFRFQSKGKNKLKPEYENRDIEPRLNQISIPLMSIVDDPAVIAEIQEHISQYNDKLKADRTLDRNYLILDAICSLMDGGIKEPTIKEVCGRYSEENGFEESIPPKKMGYFIQKHLNLKSVRTRDGYRISTENSARIEILRRRYGLPSKNPSERVNVVNNVLGKEYEAIPVIEPFR